MSCCTLYRDGGARTAADRMWAVARYYDISSKADRGDIFIVHDQKSSYRTPLTHTTFIWKVMILLLEYVSTTDHNPTATMGHSIHKVDIRKPLTHTTPYTLSVICPVQWNSSVKRTPLQSARCHWMWAFAHSSRLRRRTAVRSRPDEDDEHADELPWDGLWQFVQKFFDYANRLLQQLSGGGWSQMVLEVKMLYMEVLGWCGYNMWCAVVRPVECTAKLSEMILETTYGREMNIQFMGNSSGGHSCSQHANCTLPHNLCLQLCDKTAHFRVAFYCGQPKAHLCNNHAVKSASWYATPVRVDG